MNEAAKRDWHAAWKEQKASLLEAREQILRGEMVVYEDESPEVVVGRLERIIEQADAGIRAMTGWGDVMLFVSPPIPEDTVH